MFGIVPLFGFVSAGVALTGGIGALLAPLPLAIALGLFVGKQIGVFGAIRLAYAIGHLLASPKAPAGRKSMAPRCSPGSASP